MKQISKRKIQTNTKKIQGSSTTVNKNILRKWNSSTPHPMNPFVILQEAKEKKVSFCICYALCTQKLSLLTVTFIEEKIPVSIDGLLFFTRRINIAWVNINLRNFKWLNITRLFDFLFFILYPLVFSYPFLLFTLIL